MLGGEGTRRGSRSIDVFDILRLESFHVNHDLLKAVVMIIVIVGGQYRFHCVG